MRATLATAIGLAAWLASAAAPAQSPPADSAQAHFDRGAKLYNLGHFQEAIADFEKAYDLDPSPIFLFNIAQSHRQLGNKERALFFYRRYLEQAPGAANRDDVERRMKDLQASLQQEAELKQKPPPGVASPLEAGGGQAPPAVVERASPRSNGERRWSAALGMAPAFASMSGSAVNLPTLFAAQLDGAYAVGLPAGQLALGVQLGYARLPYTRVGTSDRPELAGTSGSSAFWALLASVRYLYGVTPNVKLGGGVGGGVVFWGGLDEGNPFTLQGVAPSGAIALPTLTASLRADIRLTGGLFVALAPELLWSKVPASAGNAIAGVISSVRRLDLAAGLGYAF